MAFFKHFNIKKIKISMKYTAGFLDSFIIVLKKHFPLNATTEKLLTIKWFEKSPFLWFSIFYSGKNICFLRFFYHILYFIFSKLDRYILLSFYILKRKIKHGNLCRKNTATARREYTTKDKKMVTHNTDYTFTISFWLFWWWLKSDFQKNFFKK